MAISLIKKPAKLSILMIALLVAGCSTPTVIVPQATGGSRSDGVVNLSFQYGPFEKPIIDWNVAKKDAQQRCKAWGYENAEPFGGAQTNCSYFYEGSCMLYLVTVPYQCQGTPK